MKKKGEKNEKKFASVEKNTLSVSERLKAATEGLIYISEIDAPFTIFESSNWNTVLAEIEKEGEISEVEFKKFFERFTRKRDWFGEREIARMKKFLDLQKLIEESLTDLKVFRIGRVKIKIVIVGRTADGHLIGLETRAIET